MLGSSVRNKPHHAVQGYANSRVVPLRIGDHILLGLFDPISNLKARVRPLNVHSLGMHLQRRVKCAIEDADLERFGATPRA